LRPFSAASPASRSLSLAGGTLLFAVLAAAWITSGLQDIAERHPDDRTPFAFGNPRHWIGNYRILIEFMELPSTGDATASRPDGTDEYRRLSTTVLKTLGDTGSGPPSPVIRDILNLEIAAQQLKENQPEAAARTLQAVTGDRQAIRRKKRELELHVLHARGRFNEFLKRTKQEPLDVFSIRKKRLDCLLRMNRRTRAGRTFKALFRRAKIGDFTDVISLPRLRSLLSQLDREDWLDKFSTLARANHFGELFRERVYCPYPDLILLFNAEYNYQRKRYSRAEGFLKRIASPWLQPHRKALEIKVSLRRGDTVSLENELESLRGTGDPYNRLLLDAAAILMTDNQTEKALAVFEKYLAVADLPRDESFWKAIWVSAWIHVRYGRLREAVKLFEKGSDSPLLGYRIASQYWMARLGRSRLQDLHDYPFTYYFIKSYPEHIQSEILKNRTFTNLVNQPLSPSTHELLALLKTLLRSGFSQVALWVIRYGSDTPELNTAERNMFRIIESIVYLRQNRFYHAFVTFRDHFECYQCIRPPRFLSAIYVPVRFEKLVREYSRINGLDPYLVMALIREESFFKTDAVSYANAHGLMQLILPTARQVAGRSSLRIHRGDLFDPEINIRLGTEYLRTLMDKYDGRLDLALAAYNAGDHRVDRWLKGQRDTHPDIFIEMIPFTATRNYVKNIIRNYYYYKHYY